MNGRFVRRPQVEPLSPSPFMRLINLFRVQSDNPALVRAQFEAFTKQAPILYFILTTNALTVSYTYYGEAPIWLAVYIPVTFGILCAVRLRVWWQRRHAQYDDAQILKQLRLTHKLAVGLAIGFTAWSLALYPYGDPYAQGLIAFFMALTVIGCIFCLMHVRSAALLVTLIVNTPFIIFFMFEGHAALRAVAVNLALVSIAMIFILMVYYRDFANLVQSRKDLTVKQEETERLSDDNFRIANLDSLTDLPNRRRFFAALNLTFEICHKSGDRFAIGIVDLDGFKPVNDTYGHATGDRVLIEAGRRLQSLCGSNIILSRLGGDEFGLVVTGNPSDSDLMALGQKLGEIVRLPYDIGASHAQISACIGFATFPDSANTPDGLFERADYALYYAKRHLRGQTVLFSQAHEKLIHEHSVVEQALQVADLDCELSVVYQPIVDARTGRIAAFEALARWQSPFLGAIGPDRFIPIAERAGLIRPMTKVLIQKALKAAASWPDHVRISINLSAQDISVAEGVVQIIACVNQSGVDPKRIDFEITETSITSDFAQARRAIDALKALGCGISLDDFGTGYSSLSHVHRLPLDKIKVDKSFISDIDINPASFKIVRSLIVLCQDMGLTCVMEGVETEAQYEILSELGGDYIQGWYFSKPMSGDLVLRYMEQDQPARRQKA
ncbi:putative bifunctional diguanylate cyclase/phosphodiesterase [Asticcacaulis endophyticus]|uniref:GGDEF-domain containing protein n=1 Tax=Asticcacaulis endophyticus TaxID=1395890 RepID=A0A918PXJ5_9CAUL|nr:EAL domain-containing protein [Asticcacaulis endophyticus]GGZ26587.1 GGDEF-domain containing protein [Asticcacaulis endophyticus]